MLALIAAKQLPGFALAFYTDLSAAGRDQPVPTRLALIADDAILLAPSPTATGWRGFLIAESTAAGQTRAFREPEAEDPCCWLAVPVPESEAAVWAEESACLPTQQSPDTTDSL